MLYFYPISPQREFFNKKNSCSREEISDLPFFFRHNCNKSLWKNLFLMSYNSGPSTLVRATFQLKLSPSPTSFLLCPFLPASLSNEATFARKMMPINSNAQSTSSIILAEEGVLPICKSHIRFSHWVISLSVE